MRVSISVGGRFHAFDLALQLLKKGFLGQLITSYPKLYTKRYGIPPEPVCSVIGKEVMKRGWDRVPASIRSLWNPDFFINTYFDRRAAKKLTSCDVFVGWANQSSRTLQKAKSFGAVTVLERGSSHIKYQNDVLRAEYERWGVRAPHHLLPHPRIIEEELREYEEADYISIPSLFVKRTFLERGFPESKLIHIPYGVDLSRFRQIPKTDDVFRVVFAGGMSLRKGVHYLLQAFSELNLPNSELLLMGGMSDEMLPFFKKYEGSYRYIGRVPQSELYKYYSQGSVFAMMSIEEGLALVQPQAMACGLPVIATTNTGAEDIVRDGRDGFIIPIRDITALKEKLIYLYENPEIRSEMGESAKERVSTGFTWDDYGKRIVEKYEECLRKKI